MKNLIIICCSILILSSCGNAKKEEKEVRYTQNSEEINTVKTAIRDYEKANWTAMKKHYADTAKIFHNSKEGKSIDEIIKSHQEELSNLSSYGFDHGEDEYEMVLTDNGDTWVNFWGDWKATMPGNNDEVIIPVHLTAQFNNGKIVKEHAYWDNSIMMMAMQEVDSTATEEDSAKASSN